MKKSTFVHIYFITIYCLLIALNVLISNHPTANGTPIYWLSGIILPVVIFIHWQYYDIQRLERAEKKKEYHHKVHEDIF